LRTPPGSSATRRARCSARRKRSSSASARATADGAWAGCQKLQRLVVLQAIGHEHVVEHRQVAAELRDLERARDAEPRDRARRQRRDVAAVEQDAAGNRASGSR
jgi:hypothetical protein